jgi:hypothetical protein
MFCDYKQWIDGHYSIRLFAISTYRASHSRVAPENVGLQKEQKCNTFVCHTYNEVRLCGLWIRKKEVGNTKRSNNDKIKIIMSLPLTLSVSREERCEVLACFHVVVKMYRYSLEEGVFIVKTYWITGSIMNCQRRFVEQFCGRNPPSKPCIQLLVAGCVAVSFRVDYLYLILSYLIFSCCQLAFSNSQNT